MVHRIRRRPDPARVGIPPADSKALVVDYALIVRAREAFNNRDLGSPTFSGTRFVRVGPLSHQYRMIVLDSIIRGFISDPTIEYFSDHSVRYHIEPNSRAIMGVVPHTPFIRPYCVLGAGQHWLYLLTPLCAKCLRPHTEHVREKCLFEPTTWTELAMDGPVTTSFTF